MIGFKRKTPADAATDALLGPSKPSRRRRIIKWTIIAVVILLVLLALSRCLKPPKPVSYATAPVTRGDLTVTVSATGNLAPTKQVNIGSEESGLVSRVYVQNNDHVAAGQALAQLDLSRLRDALLESQASQQAALASVQQGRATVAQTRANLARQQQVYTLSGGKVPSKTELDTARADYARAIANLAASQAQVAQAQAQVSTNRTNLSKGTIYSPVTGVVLSRQVEPGQTVAAAFNVATLFTIAEDLSKMKLEVKVDEADVGDLHTGAPASFTVDAYPGQTFPAQVTRVDVGANATPQVNSAGTTVSATSTVVAYTTTLTVANPALALKPGMTATADIVTAQKSGVLLVPNAALRFTPPPGKGEAGKNKRMFGPMGMQEQPKSAAIGRGAHQQLWVVGADNQPKPIPVIRGESNGTLTEVSGPGVHPGLKVITGILAGPPKP